MYSASRCILQATVYILNRLDVILSKTPLEEVRGEILPMVFNCLDSSSLHAQVIFVTPSCTHQWTGRQGCSTRLRASFWLLCLSLFVQNCQDCSQGLPHTTLYNNNNNNNNNNNRVQRRYSRFFTISSQRREMSPTRALKWPGRNRVQIACNTSSAYHVQVSCYVPLGTKGHSLQEAATGAVEGWGGRGTLQTDWLQREGYPSDRLATDGHGMHQAAVCCRDVHSVDSFVVLHRDRGYRGARCRQISYNASGLPTAVTIKGSQNTHIESLEGR